MDILGDWVIEQCEVGTEYESTASALFQSYQPWAALNGYKPLSKKGFGRRLAGRFPDKIKRNDATYYRGLRVRSYVSTMHKAKVARVVDLALVQQTPQTSMGS